MRRSATFLTVLACAAALSACSPAAPAKPAATKPAASTKPAAKPAPAVQPAAEDTPTPAWLTDQSWTSRYQGKLVTHIVTDQKLIALTLDDGPNGTTQQIVDILNRYGAHATFFFRGRGIPAAEVTAAMESGDEIGNHTKHHVELKGLSGATVLAEIQPINNQLLRIADFKPIWVRAAVGHADAKTVAVVNGNGQLYANWSIHGQDTDWTHDAARITRDVVGAAKPGAIILVHQTRPDTIKALPDILQQLGAKGYRVVTLSELASIGQPAP